MTLDLRCRLVCRTNFGSLELGAGVKASDGERDRLQDMIGFRLSDSIKILCNKKIKKKKRWQQFENKEKEKTE